MHPIFAFDISPSTLLILGLLAVLLFGERLPEVARSAGKWFMDVKRNVDGLKSEVRGTIDSAIHSVPPPPTAASDSREPSEEQTLEAASEINAPS